MAANMGSENEVFKSGNCGPHNLTKIFLIYSKQMVAK